MGKADVVCTFNLKDCMKALGVNERGRVQRFVANEVLRLCDPYVPLDEGQLKGSGHIENATDVVWNTPYAKYQYYGIVYEDPNINAAGFLTADGWRSRKGAVKVPTNRRLTYQNGALRGDHWVDRMMQNGGREEIEAGARKEVAK